MFNCIGTVVEVEVKVGIFCKSFEGHAAGERVSPYISYKDINLGVFKLAVPACMFTRCRPSCLNSVVKLALCDCKALNNFIVAMVEVVHQTNITSLISR